MEFITYIENNDVENFRRMLTENMVANPASDEFIIHYAPLILRRPALLRVLLEDGRYIPNVRDLAYVYYIPESLRLLLQDGRANPADNNSDVIISASMNHPESLRLLLEDGRANPGAQNNEAIIAAVESLENLNSVETVKLLLEDPRVNPTAQNHLALRDLAYEENVRDEFREAEGYILELLLTWYADHNVPIDQFINVIPVKYRKYILMYYDINEIPLDTFDFKITDSVEDSKFVDTVLASLAYNTEKRQRFLRLIDPTEYRLESVGIYVPGVRNMILEYADVPERSSVITQTLDDFGVPRGITAMIGKMMLDPIERKG
jgi:hypothetical protein